MSRVAAVVCEGPSDFPIVEAVIADLWPEVDDVRCLQPPLDGIGIPTSRVGGWSEVRAWCKQNANRLDFLLSGDAGDPIDLLIVCMDVDVAVAAGIENPPTETDPYVTTRLCTLVKNWLALENRRIPNAVLIGLPAMAIEAWVIAALYPKVRNAEAIRNPAEFLAGKKRLRRRTDGKPVKPVSTYRDFARTITSKLNRVREKCTEAERLCAKIERRRTMVE